MGTALAPAAAAPDPATTHTFTLRHVGAGFAYTAPVEKSTVQFKKEPPYAGTKVIRGTIARGTSSQGPLQYAWDVSGGKLYLDRNRNPDLTDETPVLKSGALPIVTEFNKIKIDNRVGSMTLAKHLRQACLQQPALCRKRIHPHSIRHSTAVHLLKSGVDPSTIANWLGHASEQSMGHAPKGITARHYIPRLSAVTKGEEGVFAQAMKVFKTLIVDHVNRMAESSGAKILNFFERPPERAKVEEA